MFPAPHNTRSVATVSAALSAMPLSHRLGVMGVPAMFALTLWAQRYTLWTFNRCISTVHTEDDTRVTRAVFHHFFRVARIALPTWRCREALGSVVFILLFAVKAFLRVWVSKVNGEVLATMLQGDRSERLLLFVRKVMVRIAVGLASAMAGSTIEIIRSWLIGCYHERLSRTFQRRFYERLVYYRGTVLDNRLKAADTVISTYCGEFAEHFAELPYYFLLPGLECITAMVALVEQAGLKSALLTSATASSAVLLLRRLAPAFGRIHSQLLSREDDHRRMLTKSLTDVESIAMHGAGEFTRRRLDASLAKLKESLDHVAIAKGNFEMVETTFSTFMTVAAHTLAFTRAQHSDSRRLINDVYLQVQLIEDLNKSTKEFVVNFRELSHLTEFATKISEFDATLESIAAGTLIQTPTEAGGTPHPSSPLPYTPMSEITHPPGANIFPLVKMEGLVLESPTGQRLLSNMNLEFGSEENWVVIGENGCGKTSFLRMLCGLWMPKSGVLSKDKSVRFLLAPQHSYMVPQCTLYEQICFPGVVEPPTPQIRRNVQEAIELAGAQTVVNVIRGYESAVMGLDLSHTDDSYDWSSLSGGQKERISMARVFFHVLCMDRTKEIPVALLDEATSMMDSTEQDVLNNLRRMNVRMISITHRDTVIRHHTNVLRISRGGKWSVERVTDALSIGERARVEGMTA